jgi:hypothetical protein
MPRQPRIQYPGAMRDVMSRGTPRSACAASASQGPAPAFPLLALKKNQYSQYSQWSICPPAPNMRKPTVYG